MTHWHDGFTKGSDWREKIVTPLAAITWIGMLIFLTYWSATH